MKLIIGLGNPGDKYKKTRHNLGFRVIDALRQNLEFGIWHLAKKFNAFISEGTLNNQKIILAKPQTYMNKSGLAVKSLIENLKLKIENLLVIHDDMDLPLGEIRLQKGRGSAGHKGVQSIIDGLGTKNFTRMRIGIASATINNQQLTTNTEKFVLEKFTPQEEKTIKEVIKRATETIAQWLK